MEFKIWLLLSGVSLALAKNGLEKVQWQGSYAKLGESGEMNYCGIATRAQFYKNSAFLCTPRGLKNGCNATLLKMSLDDPFLDNPNIERFPLSTPQTEGECGCLQSAVDTYLDDKDILWVLDGGFLKFNQSNDGEVVTCSPKVFGFDAQTGATKHVIDLKDQLTPLSCVQFIVADYNNDNCYLYISDAASSGIIVWDVTKGAGLRVVVPDEVENENFIKDVLYLALVKKHDQTLLYFTYRSGKEMYCIVTKHLQENNMAPLEHVGTKTKNMIILGTDKMDSIFFRYEDKPDIYKWDTKQAFDDKNFKLVHIGGNLTPTHAMPYNDNDNTIMMLCESNIYEYLCPALSPKDSFNSLTKMNNQ